MLGGQPRNLRPSLLPAWQAERFAPAPHPRELCCSVHGSTLEFLFKVLLGFQPEIELFPSKAETAVFPSPGNQLLYYPVHPSAKQNPPRASHWAPVMTVPMLRARSPRRPHQRSSQPDLSKHIWSSAGKPVYHFPSGSFILFKGEEKGQGLRNVCSLFHSRCKDVTGNRSDTVTWEASGLRAQLRRRGKAECY